jgi:hypothetical protein
MVLRTNGRNGRHNLTEFQLVENRRLSRSVQADHQNTHLLLAPEAIKELRES